MKQVNPPPNIEGVMSVIRQKEGVMNTVSRISLVCFKVKKDVTYVKRFTVTLMTAVTVIVPRMRLGKVISW